MATKRNETEYMYSSARARSLENRIADAERLSHMAEAESAVALGASLPELGFEIVYDGKGKFCREKTLESVLKEGYAEAESMVSDGDFFNFLRYGYDCHNIKSMIKCFSRGVSHKEMLIPLGSVDIEALEEAYATKNYACLPDNMAKGAIIAEEALAASKNPQKVDLILDRACYADMLANAERHGIPMVLRLVRTKIDLTNLLTTVRFFLMSLKASAEPLLGEALIDGGSLDASFWRERFSEGAAKLGEALEFTSLAKLSPYVSGDVALRELERRADDMWMGIAKEARYIPFGPEILIGYLIALEFQVKNIRILLAGKDAELSASVIRERLRESYV